MKDSVGGKRGAKLDQERVAVVGAGLMGQGIAVVFARAGYTVRVHDQADRLEPNMDRILERLHEAGSAESLQSAAGAVEMAQSLSDAVDGASFVFEAVPESLSLKVDILRALDAVADDRTAFATNTSSLPLTQLGESLSETRKLIAVHFFNPAEIVPGVEVAGRSDADLPVVDRICEMLARAGKKPIRVKAVPGFISNRLQLALFREAVLCVEEGIASPGEIDEIVRSTFGLRLSAYGPFQIADMAGLNVFAAILDTLTETYGSRFEEPALLRRVLNAGRLGLSTGSGFFDYTGINSDDLARDRNAAYRSILAGRKNDIPDEWQGSPGTAPSDHAKDGLK